MVNHTDLKAQEGEPVQFDIESTQQLLVDPSVITEPGGESVSWWMEDDNYTFTMPALDVAIHLNYATADDL